MNATDAIKMLAKIGAKNERREGRDGRTLSGWWLDGVWLAPSNRPQDAIRTIKGG